MELKAGYKKTEAGLIPLDWNSKNLGDVMIHCFSGATPSRRHPEFYKGNIRWITSGELNYNIITDTIEKISKDALVKTNLKLIPKGTFLMAITGLEAEGTRGSCGIVGEESATNQSCMAIFPTSELLTEYLFHYYVYKGKVLALKYCQGTKQQSYTAKIVKLIPVPLPPLLEQSAIAIALSDVDALIVALDQLINKKRDIKQAVMQELLTGKKRLPGFSGELSSVCLGELGNFSKGKGIKKDDVIASGIPCVRYGEIYTHYNDYIKEVHSFISVDIAKESQQIKSGDLLFAGSGETAEEIGKCVAYLKDEEAYAGGDIVIFSPREQNSMYLGYLMNHPSIVVQKARMGQGDAVVHISGKNLAELKLRLPPLEEQIAIAAVFSDMGAEIAALEARREKTCALKEGMMQELLTGRIRLVKGAEA